MDNIQIMMSEHQLILRALFVARKVALSVMHTAIIPYEDLTQLADFVKNYADIHHHGKEEAFLFKEMEARLPGAGAKLIRNGMLVEHDLGRYYMLSLKEAIEKSIAGDEDSRLDIIANLVSYTHLLHRHIQKEDELVYVFGRNNLPEAVMAQIDAQAEAFEKEAAIQGIQKKYLELVESLERKYL